MCTRSGAGSAGGGKCARGQDIVSDGGKAWGDAFDFPLLGRSAKPRTNGLTMVIDKGLGLSETRDLLELAHDYIDYLKLTFGTSAFYAIGLLREKIALVRSRGVRIFPGGTFLEVALLQGKLERFLDRAAELGFDTVEVSDGTIVMPPEQRRWCILQARRRGLRVISEVGKKDPADEIAPALMLEQVQADLEAGADRVIVEGRESGQGVVIYDKQGNIKVDTLEALAGGLPDPSVLMWEAPLKAQQQALIMRFGPNVNLGNVAPSDILALEALRCGLRGDTLKAALKTAQGAAL